MSPRTASTYPIDRLIADLQSSDPVRRDASVARLRVLGPRVLPRLVLFIESATAANARAHAIAVLDGMQDRRVPEIALAALVDPDVPTVIAALGVLRGWVSGERGTRLLEAISAIAVDTARDARVRVAAIDALSDLPDDLVRPIREQGPPPEAGGPPLDNPVAAREWVEAHGGTATLATLHDAIKSFRDSEGRERIGRARQEWIRARGAAHQLLADRGSRLALYDARETVSTAQSPLPPGFLEAMGRLGDATCLEPLARAWAATREAGWRAKLAETARHIVTRSKLSGRNAVVKGIRANWAGFI